MSRRCPSRQDPLVAAASDLVGGPPGAHARRGRLSVFWTPLRILLLLAVLASTLGYAQKVTCRDSRNWAHDYQYTRVCYSDVVALYGSEGLADGKRPYLDSPVEYPPLIGAAMQLASSVAGHASGSQPVYRTDSTGALLRDAKGAPIVDHYGADRRTETFYDVTALLLLLATCVTVLCTALTLGRRRIWDAAFVALAPALVFNLDVNWDMIAVAFTAGAMLAWSKKAPTIAGIMLGLGAATKAYPLLLLVPLGLLCWRVGHVRTFVRTLVASLVTLVVVVLPVWAVAGSFAGQTRVGPSAWNTFWAGGDWVGALAPHHDGGANGLLRFVDLNQERGADWGSSTFGLEWLAQTFSPAAFGPVHLLVIALAAAAAWWGGRQGLRRWPEAPVAVAVGVTVTFALVVALTPALLSTLRGPGGAGPAVGTVNLLTLAAFLILLAGIAALALAAPRRPRLGQLAFLAVAAFLLTNKVYSPQYVLWLVPLYALARPRWRGFLVWQAAEVAALVLLYMHLIFNSTSGAHGIDRGWYVGALTVRDVVLAGLAVLVVREIMRRRSTWSAPTVSTTRPAGSSTGRRTSTARTHPAGRGASRWGPAHRDRHPSGRPAGTGPHPRPRRSARPVGRLPEAVRATLPLWFASRVGVALVSFVAARTVAEGSGAQVAGFRDLWARWDVLLFTKVARDGYLSPGPPTNTEVDFPGFPLLLRLFHLFLRDWTVSGLVVSFLAGAVACACLWRLAADEVGPERARWAVVALILAPYAVFLFAGYSEGLFLALSVGAWLAARRGRWWTAGLLGFGAAATRVTGMPLCLALAVEYVVSRRRAGLPLIAPVAGSLALPPLGAFAFVAYLHARTGHWDTYTRAMRAGWGRTVTWPWEGWSTSWREAFDATQPAAYVWFWRAELAAVVLGVVLTVVLLRGRRWGEGVYVAASTLLMSASSYYASGVRTALVWFPLWLLAGRLATRHGRLRPVYAWIAGPVMVVIVVAFTQGRWVD